MRLSGEDQQGSTEMRQVVGNSPSSSSLVDPLVTRPQVYYGEGPFDPPSSDEDEEEERIAAAQHNFEDDAETVSLLSNTPSTPGRAERGGATSPRRSPEAEEVRLFFSDSWRKFRFP